MKQNEDIKQNWKGTENFDICFCVIFKHYCRSFISGRETRY